MIDSAGDVRVLLTGCGMAALTTILARRAGGRLECAEPFVRIAAGTEHRLSLEPLAESLVSAIAAVLRR